MIRLVIVLCVARLCFGSASQSSPLPLFGGSYQTIYSNDTCLQPNRFTASCSCPSTWSAHCFDVLVYEDAAPEVSNTVSYSAGSTLIESSFCLCDRTGLSSAAVFGGAFQSDDPTACSLGCRYANPHTGNCSCPSGYSSSKNSIRTLATGKDNCILGSHIYVCQNSDNDVSVGATAVDTTSFLLNGAATSVTVLNNFHGVYTISTNMSTLECLTGNNLAVRTSRYMSSIDAETCNCPDNACGASFYWATDLLGGDPLQMQRVAVCESSFHTPVDTSTPQNKVMFGYQMWQSVNLDSYNLGWVHWLNPDDPIAEAFFDIWPDVSELPSAALANVSGLAFPDGTPGQLYDAYISNITALHVKWLQDYGLDGMWLQRFLSEVQDFRFFDARNAGVQHLRDQSELRQRVFALMWDVSGIDSEDLVSFLMRDVAAVIDLNIFNSSAYLRHNDKPLIALWGLGIRTDINSSSALAAVQLMTSMGFAVMGGVVWEWRSDSSDWQEVYDAMDIISPWAVGVFLNPDNYLSFALADQEADLAYLNQSTRTYAPVAFPGFSWYNLNAGPFNQMPRIGGLFWQTQADAYTEHLFPHEAFSHTYLAMFDEFDEGTAMTKGAESSLDKPIDGTWLSWDQDGYHIPNDHYLCLSSRQTYRQHQPLTVYLPWTFVTAKTADQHVSAAPHVMAVSIAALVLASVVSTTLAVGFF